MCTGMSGVYRYVRCTRVCQVCTGMSGVRVCQVYGYVRCTGMLGVQVCQVCTGLYRYVQVCHYTCPFVKFLVGNIVSFICNVHCTIVII